MDIARIDYLWTELKALEYNLEFARNIPDDPAHKIHRDLRAEFQRLTGKDYTAWTGRDMRRVEKEELLRQHALRKEAEEQRIQAELARRAKKTNLRRDFNIIPDSGAPNIGRPRTSTPLPSRETPSPLYTQKRDAAIQRLSSEEKQALSRQVQQTYGPDIRPAPKPTPKPTGEFTPMPASLRELGTKVGSDPGFRVAYYGALRNRFADNVAEHFKANAPSYNAAVAKQAQGKFVAMSKEYHKALNEYYRDLTDDPARKVDLVRDAYHVLSSGNAQSLNQFFRDKSNPLILTNNEPFTGNAELQKSLSRFALQAMVNRAPELVSSLDDYSGLRIVKQAIEHPNFKKRFGRFASGGGVGGIGGFASNLGPHSGINRILGPGKRSQGPGLLGILHPGEVVLNQGQVQELLKRGHFASGGVVGPGGGRGNRPPRKNIAELLTGVDAFLKQLVARPDNTLSPEDQSAFLGLMRSFGRPWAKIEPDADPNFPHVTSRVAALSELFQTLTAPTLKYYGLKEDTTTDTSMRYKTQIAGLMGRFSDDELTKTHAAEVVGQYREFRNLLKTQAPDESIEVNRETLRGKLNSFYGIAKREVQGVSDIGGLINELSDDFLDELEQGLATSPSASGPLAQAQAKLQGKGSPSALSVRLGVASQLPELAGLEPVVNGLLRAPSGSLSDTNRSSLERLFARFGQGDISKVRDKQSALLELSQIDVSKYTAHLKKDLRKQVKEGFEEGMAAAVAASANSPKFHAAARKLALTERDIRSVKEVQDKVTDPIHKSRLESRLAELQQRRIEEKQILDAAIAAENLAAREAHGLPVPGRRRTVPSSGGPGGPKTPRGGGGGGGRSPEGRGPLHALMGASEPASLFSTFVGDLFLIGEVSYALSQIGAAISGVFIEANAQLEVFLTTLSSTLGTAEKAKKVFEGFAQPFALEVPFFESKDLISTINKLAAEGFTQQSLTGNLDITKGPKYQGSVVKSIVDLAAAFGTTPDQATDAFIAATQNRFVRLRQYGISREDLKTFGFSGSAQDSEGAVSALQKVIQLRFAGTVERLGKTFKGASSNVQDFLQTIIRLSTESSFQEVTNFLVQAAEGANTLAGAFGEADQSASAASKAFASYLKEDVGGLFGGLTKRALEFLQFMVKFKAQIAAVFAIGIAPFVLKRAGDFATGLVGNVARIGIDSAIGKKAKRALLGDVENFGGVLDNFTAKGAVEKGFSLERSLAARLISAKAAAGIPKGLSALHALPFENRNIAKGLAGGETFKAASSLRAGLNIGEAILKNFGPGLDKLQDGIGIVRQLSAEVVAFGSVAAGVFKFSLVNSVFEGIGAFDDLRKGIQTTGRVLRLKELGENLRETEQLTLGILNNIGKAFGQTFGESAQEGPFLGLTNAFVSVGNTGFSVLEKLTSGFAVFATAIFKPLSALNELRKGLDAFLKGGGLPDGTGTALSIGGLALGIPALFANPKVASTVFSKGGALGLVSLLAALSADSAGKDQYLTDEADSYSRTSAENVARLFAGNRLFTDRTGNAAIDSARFAGEGLQKIGGLGLRAASIAGGAFVGAKGLQLIDALKTQTPTTVQRVGRAVAGADSLRGLGLYDDLLTAPKPRVPFSARVQQANQLIRNPRAALRGLGGFLQAGGEAAFAGLSKLRGAGPLALAAGVAEDVIASTGELVGEPQISNPYLQQFAQLTRKSPIIPIGTLSNVAGVGGAIAGSAIPGLGPIGGFGGLILAEVTSRKVLGDLDKTLFPNVDERRLRRLTGNVSPQLFEQIKKITGESDLGDLVAGAKTPAELRKTIPVFEKLLEKTRAEEARAKAAAERSLAPEIQTAQFLTRRGVKKATEQLGEDLAEVPTFIGPDAEKGRAADRASDVDQYYFAVERLKKEEQERINALQKNQAIEKGYYEAATAQAKRLEAVLKDLKLISDALAPEEALVAKLKAQTETAKKGHERVTVIEEEAARDKQISDNIDTQILLTASRGDRQGAELLREKKKEDRRARGPIVLGRVERLLSEQNTFQTILIENQDTQAKLKKQLQDTNKKGEIKALGDLQSRFKIENPETLKEFQTIISRAITSDSEEGREAGFKDLDRLLKALRPEDNVKGASGATTISKFINTLRQAAGESNQLRKNLEALGVVINDVGEKSKNAGIQISNLTQQQIDDAQKQLEEIQTDLAQKRITPLDAASEIRKINANVFSNPLLADSPEAKEAKLRQEQADIAAEQALRGRTELAREMTAVLSDTLTAIDAVTRSLQQLDSLDSGRAFEGTIQQVRALSRLVDAALPGTDQYTQLVNEFNQAVGQALGSYDKLLQLRQKDIDLLRQVANLQEQNAVQIRTQIAIEQVPLIRSTSAVPTSRAELRAADRDLTRVSIIQEQGDAELRRLQFEQQQQGILDRIADRNETARRKAGLRSTLAREYQIGDLVAVNPDEQAEIERQNAEDLAEGLSNAQRQYQFLLNDEVNSRRKINELAKQAVELKKEERELAKAIADRDEFRIKSRNNLFRAIYRAQTGADNLPEPVNKAIQIGELFETTRKINTLFASGAKRDDILKEVTDFGNALGDIKAGGISEKEKPFVKEHAKSFASFIRRLQKTAPDTELEDQQAKIQTRRGIVDDLVKAEIENLRTLAPDKERAHLSFEQFRKSLDSGTLARIQADADAKADLLRPDLKNAGLKPETLFLKGADLFTKAVEKFAAAVGFKDTQKITEIVGKQRELYSDPRNTTLGAAALRGTQSSGIPRRSAASKRVVSDDLDYSMATVNHQPAMELAATNRRTKEHDKATQRQVQSASDNQVKSDVRTQVQLMQQMFKVLSMMAGKPSTPTKNYEAHLEKGLQSLDTLVTLLSNPNATEDQIQQAVDKPPTRTVPSPGFSSEKSNR